MKYMHTSDNRCEDLIWIWINWIGFIFQILVAIGLTATLFYISLREKADAIFPLMIIILIGLVDCGILDASWRNGRRRMALV